jgi:hypothetical protein
MNELQIRLTADIKDLQSAINKAKATLKSFESETAKDSDKSNVGFRRKIGLIEQLTAKAKELKVSISQATNEKQIAGFNAQLEQTNQELTRLNALGKSFANTSTQSFNKFRVSAGAANGSAIAFNRVIQDAPFGIIGVGNNIQQLAEQFSALRITTGSTGTALSTFFKSLFTGSNLLVLGISAATAAFTAYQLGAFDSAEETKDLAKELDDYKNSLDDVTKAQLEGAQSAQSEIQALKLLKLQAENANLPLEKRILAVKELRNQFPDYFKGLSDEQILLGNVGGAYDKLTKSIVANARAKAFSQQITENEKQTLALLLQEEQRALEILDKRSQLEKARIGEQLSGLKVAGQFTASNIEANRLESELNDLIQQTSDSAEERKKIALETLSIESKIPAEIEKAGGLIDTNTESYKKLNDEVDKLKRTFEAIISLPNGGLPREGDVEALRERFQKIQTGGQVGQTGQEFIQSSLQQVIDKGIITSLPTKEVSDNFQELSDEIKFTVDDLAQAFTGLGSVIGRAFNNPQLGTFLGTFLTFASKLVAANFKIAGSNAVAGASQASLATGPAAPLTLPGFIAGALGVVAAAFAAFGNFGSSSSSSMSSGSGSTFTNRREFGGPVSKGRAYIVGERRPELFVPNTNGVIIPQVPSMDYSGTSMSAGAMAIDVNIQGVSYGDDILFTVQQAQIRRNIR